MSFARVTRRLATLGALLLTAACDGDEELAPVPIELRAASTDLLAGGATSDGGLVLQNLDETTVYWFAADQQALALIDWVPCTDPSRCDGIPPRATVSVPRSRIVADQPGSRAVIVYHWRLVRHGARIRPDSIRWMVVAR
jgi:hypothetical protein